MTNKKKKPEWKGYEELIHKIYKELEPIADVKLNDHITGFKTLTPRQIDISIRKSIAGHEILIIIQAKDYKKRADVNTVGEFAAVIDDVQASKGILICNSGFTKTAKEYAKKCRIDLCTAHDASNIKWQTEIQVPVIKKSIKVKLKLQHHFAVVGPVDLDGIHLPFPEVALKVFTEKWDKNEISKEPGTHNIYLDRESIHFQKELVPILNNLEYTIIHRHHFKFFIPTEYRGVKNYITETFTASFMAFNESIPFLDDGTWKFIESLEDISIKSKYLNIEIIDIDLLKKKLIRIDWDERTH